MPSINNGPSTAVTQNYNQVIADSAGNLYAAGQQVTPSGGGVSGFTGATYEVSGLFRLLSYVAGGVTYAVAYGANTITITGSDASTKLITLDGSGRIVSVV